MAAAPGTDLSALRLLVRSPRLRRLASLTFGSLISATDPVTVLAVFQKLGVKVDLFSMVFGESVLNDAVAIVLSRTLLSFNEPGTEVDQESILAACQLFGVIFVGSGIIGGVGGVIASLVFKVLDLKHHDELLYMEAALSFAFPWCAYFVAEASELSGIVAILACGMVMATYTRPNFSPRAIRLTARAYKCVALIAETFVFVYLGMAVITFPIFTSTVWQFTFWATMACFVGRLHIYIGSWMTNWFRGPDSDPPPISPAFQFVMWFSGLRGGVAFALASVSFVALDFPQTCGGITGPNADDIKLTNPHCTEDRNDSLAILQATMLIAVFTIFVFGGAITSVAIAYDVLEKKGRAEPVELRKSTTGDSWTFSDVGHNFLLGMLTHEKTYARESRVRFDAVYKPEHDVEGEFSKLKREFMSARPLVRGSTTKDMKFTLTEEHLTTVRAPGDRCRVTHPHPTAARHSSPRVHPAALADPRIAAARAADHEGGQSGRPALPATEPLDEAAREGNRRGGGRPRPGCAAGGRPRA